MNHWESFGCFFQVNPTPPLPLSLQKKEDLQPRTSSFPPGNICLFTQKKNGQSGYMFYQTLRPALLLGLQIHTTWDWDVSLVQPQRNRKCSNDLFYSPPKKKER